jgi:pimeloyl-ACP methyl ester carboxylesterase
MKFANGRAAGLHYMTYSGVVGGAGDPGGAPPLLILPGLLSDGRQLKRLVRGLQRPALVVDPLGSGQSELPAQQADYGLPQQAERLLALLDALGLPQVDVAGISMGGMWAQHALLRAPTRFRRALLVGTAASVEPRLRSVLLGLQAQWRAGVSMLDLWRTLQVLFFSAEFLDRPGIIPMLENLATMEEKPAAAVDGQLQALLAHDLSAELRRVRQVCLVFAGGEDFVMPRGTQERLCAALGYGPPVLAAGAGHAIWIEQPEVLCQALARALE